MTKSANAPTSANVLRGARLDTHSIRLDITTVQIARAICRASKTSAR